MARGLPAAAMTHKTSTSNAFRPESMELTAEEAWSRILQGARTTLPEQGFRTWLAPTTALALSDEGLVVAAPSDFAAEWIEDKYGDLLSGLAHRLFGNSFSLTFESESNSSDIATLLPELVAADPEGKREAASPEGRAALPSGKRVVGALNPRYTLDRFVVAGNNQLSAAACQAVAEAPGRAYNPLFIYGGVGLGKTHLMHGIAHMVLVRFPDRRIAYMPTEQFTNELIAAIQSRTTGEFHRRYRSIDVLLVDDVQFLADKERTQEEFFHTFNALHDAQKQIVLTSDRLPKEIPGLQERLVSRFEWGLVTDVKPPDFETRVAILRFKAEQDGLPIAEDVLTLIADRCRSSVRELEGAIIKLLAYSSLTRREITTELAQEAFGGGSPTCRDLGPGDVEAAVAKAFGVTRSALRSPSRARQVTLPRQVAMYLMKALLKMPYSDIGRQFGGRDHSTVIHSIRKIEQLLPTDEELRTQIQSIRSGLE